MPYNVKDSARGNGNRGRGQANPDFVAANLEYLDLSNRLDELRRQARTQPGSGDTYHDEWVAIRKRQAELRPLLASLPRTY